MQRISFSAKGLVNYLESNPPVGEEVCAIEDSRWRCWNRAKGLTLGYEVYSNGKRERKVIGRLGDINLTDYKTAVQRIIADRQLNGISQAGCSLKQYFESTYMNYSRANHKDQRSVLVNWKRLSGPFKAKNLSSINRVNIENELQQLLVDRGLSNASFNRVRALLSSIFRLAVADGLIPSSPVTHVKSRHEQIQPAFALSAEAYKRYVELAFKADNQVHGYALALAALSGARISEIRSIKVADVAENLRMFTLRDTKNLDSRSVHIGPTAAEAIKAAMCLSTNQFLFSSIQSGTGFIGYPRDAHDKLVDQMIDEGVIEKPFPVKALRSTVGTKIFQATGSLENVRRQLGHRTLTVPAKHYLHPSNEHCQEVVSVLENSLKVA